MEFQKIKYEVQENIAAICLNSPRNLNAFDELVLDELVEAFRLAEEDTAVRVSVLTGTGRAFSAGGDIGAMYAGIKAGNLDLGGAVNKMANVALAIKRSSKPVIASVRGAVAGAGFNTALACDFCIAAESATFMEAFVNIGLIPDAGGLFLLTRAVGVNRAIDLAMTGRPVSAAEGATLGFVNQVCPDGELEGKTRSLAQKLSRGPALSYANIKKLVYESQYRDFETYIQMEIAAQTACGDSADFKEGILAFVEKRRANFA